MSSKMKKPTPPRKTKGQPVTITEMRAVMCRENNINPLHYAFVSDSIVKKQYENLSKARTEHQALEQKRKALRAQIKKATKELHGVLGKLEKLQWKGPLVPPDPKEGAVKMIYSCVTKQQYVGMGHESIGGTYAHLRKGAIEKVFHLMKTKAEFDRKSVLFDVGSGLNVPCLHAATSHCKYAVGVEIDKMRTRQSAQLALEYFKTQCNEPRNHRVAVINADVLDLLPVDFATHAYMFDLVFPDDVYIKVIEWLRRSTFRYLITFKAGHWTSWIDYIVDELGAEEVGHLGGLHFSGSDSSATALIFRLKERKERDMSECDGLIDANELVAPFLQGTIDDTVQRYEALIEELSADLEDKERDCKKRAVNVDIKDKEMDCKRRSRRSNTTNIK